MKTKSAAPELLAGMEMGQDALRVLRESFKFRVRILAEIATKLPHVHVSVICASRLVAVARKDKMEIL